MEKRAQKGKPFFFWVYKRLSDRYLRPFLIQLGRGFIVRVLAPSLPSGSSPQTVIEWAGKTPRGGSMIPRFFFFALLFFFLFFSKAHLVWRGVKRNFSQHTVIHI